MKEHEVKENENLEAIAEQFHFNSINPILEANKELKLKPNCLRPGQIILIPENKEKKVKNSSGTEYPILWKIQFQPLYYLWISIEDPDHAIDIGTVKLYVSNSQRDIFTFSKYLSNNDSTGRGISNPNASRMVVVVTKHYGFVHDKEGNLKFNCSSFGSTSEINIKLEIGGLDPIYGLEKHGNTTAPKISARAIQKLLSNLSYFSGPIDGNLESQNSKSAIIQFQNNHNIPNPSGIIDEDTLLKIHLVNAQKSDFAYRKEESLNDEQKQVLPFTTPLLKRGYFDGRKSSKTKLYIDTILSSIDDYFEPSGFNPLQGHPKRINLTNKDGRVNSEYPEKIYVAPSFFDCGCSKGQTCELHKNPEELKKKLGLFKPDFPNIVKSKIQNYIFLDCGKWKGDHANFGVVWGRNVYLCSYVPIECNPARNFNPEMVQFVEKHTFGEEIMRREGIDYNFFLHFINSIESSEFKVEIEKSAFCSWGHDDEYDFENLHVIIPDLHLYAPTTTHVMQLGDYKLEAELKLLKFAIELVKFQQKDKIKVIQLGDSYDLWVDVGFIREDQIRDLVNDIYNVFKWFYQMEIGTFLGYQNRNFKFSKEQIQAILKDAYGLKHDYLKQYIHFVISNYSRYPTYVENDFLQMAINPEMTINTETGEKVKLKIVDKKKLNRKIKDWWNKIFDSLKPTDLNNYWVNSDTLMGGELDKFSLIMSCFNESVDPYEIIGEQVNRIRGLMEDTYQSYYNQTTNKDYKKNFELYKKLCEEYKIKNTESNKYINPATIALRYLEDNLGDKMIYLYGNHDNYLIDNKLTNRITLHGKPMKPRKLHYESKSLYVEHGHRLEYEFQIEDPKYYLKERNNTNIKYIGGRAFVADTFLSIAYNLKGTIPANYDGCISGFIATCENLRDKHGSFFDKQLAEILADAADVTAGGSDQPSYKRSFSRLKVGRILTGSSVPNIFVIGHTHVATLEIVQVIGTNQKEYEEISKHQSYPL